MRCEIQDVHSSSISIARMALPSEAILCRESPLILSMGFLPHLQSALRLKPFFTDAYNNMASALVQKGLIPQAMECYMSALRINPNLVSFGHAISCRLVGLQAGGGSL